MKIERTKGLFWAVLALVVAVGISACGAEGNSDAAGGDMAAEATEREGGEHSEGGEQGGHEEGEGHEAGGDGRSSEIVPLGQRYSGELDGLVASLAYDAATRTVSGTVTNTTSETLYSVQTEHHLKLGERTVGEMATERLGDIAPGETVQTRAVLRERDRERLGADGAFDGYTVHLEVLGRDGTQEGDGEHGEGREGEHGGEGQEGEGEHGGEGREGDGEHGGEEGREGGGEHGGEGREGGEEHGGEGREGGGEHGGEEGGHDEGGEEGGEGGTYVEADATWDMVRRGARLVLSYDAQRDAFVGRVENTTTRRICAIRVEVHTAGVELGPTTRTDIPAGGSINIVLPAEGTRVSTWTAHPEQSAC